jgi:hypothetical protein
MSRVLPAVAGIVASSMGCAQLAGINETNGKNRNKDSLVLTRTSVGATVVTAPLNLTGLQATYFLPTDTPSNFERVTADPGNPADGTWIQDLPDPVPVQFTLPDDPMPVPRLVNLPSRALSVAFTSLEHPNRTPAPAGAMLTVTTPLDVGVAVGDTFQAYTVGSWTLHALPPPAVATPLQIGPSVYAFNTSTSRSGRAQFDQITMQDAFFVLRYNLNGLTGIAEAPPFDQTGADTVVTPKMTQVVQDQMLDMRVSPTSLAMRYATVRPSVGAIAMNWSVVAAPGYLNGMYEGPVLQKGAVVMIDTVVTGKYSNPFVPARDWRTVFALQTSESRAYTPPGSLPVTLFAGMEQFLDPTAVAPGFELTEPASLPVLISIDGKQLAIDGLTISAPTKFVEVTFLPENMTDTLFNLQVFDLLPNAGGTALEYHLAYSATSNDATASHEARFAIPPEIFQVGHRYTLRAICIHEGYPAFADGDFTNRRLPLSQSFLDSGVFTVTP